MKSKTLTIWTIVLNFFIPIAAGHGIAFLGLIEIFWIPNFYDIATEDFSFSPASGYDKTLGFVAILSLTGQLVLIVSFFTKSHLKVWFHFFGLSLLWMAFFYLAFNIFEDSASQFSFITGLPFFIVSLILAIKIIRNQHIKTNIKTSG